MPKSGVTAEEAVDLVDKVLKGDGKLIGLCFMDMFRKAGRDKKIDFDCIIDALISGFVYGRS